MIELDVFQVQESLMIDIDEDAWEALAFIKETLTKQVKELLQPPWVPVFEASYGPGDMA